MINSKNLTWFSGSGFSWTPSSSTYPSSGRSGPTSCITSRPASFKSSTLFTFLTTWSGLNIGLRTLCDQRMGSCLQVSMAGEAMAANTQLTYVRQVNWRRAGRTPSTSCSLRVFLFLKQRSSENFKQEKKYIIAWRYSTLNFMKIQFEIF